MGADRKEAWDERRAGSGRERGRDPVQSDLSPLTERLEQATNSTM